MPTGYHGIWYGNQKPEQYGCKCSGGLATYPRQQMPIAPYDAVARKTFFDCGGDDGHGQLENRVDAFDHPTDEVLRRERLLHRPTRVRTMVPSSRRRSPAARGRPERIA